MPRRVRECSGNLFYHVLHRAVERGTLFHQEQDYLACERVLEPMAERTSTRLLAYCVTPNLWRLLWWPREDGERSEVMRRLTATHPAVASPPSFSR